MKLKAQKLSSFFQKAQGVIGRQKITPVYFETRFGIHTFGVRQEIDVVILNDSKEVVTFKSVKPNRFYFWNPIYKKVLELPMGSIKKLKIIKKTKITIE